MFPCGGTDAQWIVDLADNNGSYWFQDEVGKFIKKVLADKNYLRIKDWVLNAYSREQISNRLKSEANKLTIDDPHFTFFGLTVRETWKYDIDATSMLDGFCQRFNYVIAPERVDTDMFDHFINYYGKEAEAKKRKLQTTWNALCDQPNALDQYRLKDDVLPYLQSWFRGLRGEWGSGALPGSFIRRTGFSVLSYLVVIHFLLGRSNSPIDIETAEIATRYAEFHMESALIMIREYGDRNANHVQKVSQVRESLLAKWENDTPGSQKTVGHRDIQRRLSTRQRKEIPIEKIKDILEVLNRIEVDIPLLKGTNITPMEKSAVLQERNREIREREQKTEQSRNQKRLQTLQNRYAKRLKDQECQQATSSGTLPDDDTSCVIEFETKLTKKA